MRAPGGLPVMLGVAVALFALGACGGDDDDQSDVASPRPTKGNNDEPAAIDKEFKGPINRRGQRASVRETVEAVLTRAGSPAEGCEGFVLPEFVERSYGSKRGCMAARRSGGLARSVRISGAAVNGPVASVKAIPSGGPYDGERLRIRLAFSNPTGAEGGGGVWRIENIRANILVGP